MRNNNLWVKSNTYYMLVFTDFKKRDYKRTYVVGIENIYVFINIKNVIRTSKTTLLTYINLCMFVFLHTYFSDTIIGIG